MSTENAWDLEWCEHQIQSISKDLYVSQITRGQVPGKPPFLVLHLKAANDTSELAGQLEKWKEKFSFEIFFDIELIEGDELFEYQNNHFLVSRHH